MGADGVLDESDRFDPAATDLPARNPWVRPAKTGILHPPPPDSAQGGVQEVDTFDLGASEVTLPEDLPEPNDLVRSIFRDDTERGALEFVVDEELVYLLPWAARHGGVAGYRQAMDTFHVRPVEFSAEEVGRLLEAHPHREVPLSRTPAWLLDDRGVDDVWVSWHARVRWGERVDPSPDPGPAIRDAFEAGVNVGLEHGRGRYYPPAGIVLAYVSDHGRPRVTTVYHPEDVDDLGVDHLVECPHCGDLYDPGEQDRCSCCGGPVCPWCGETVA